MTPADRPERRGQAPGQRPAPQEGRRSRRERRRRRKAVDVASGPATTATLDAPERPANATEPADGGGARGPVTVPDTREAPGADPEAPPATEAQDEQALPDGEHDPPAAAGEPSRADGEPAGVRRRAAGAAAREVAGDPEQAFDRLHRRHAGPLTRQALLLCGDPREAEHAVATGFRLAWERWPEVSVDPDPPGWVRATVHSCALSPWRASLTELRNRLRRRAPTEAAVSPADRAVLDAVLALPPAHRRCLVLHDGLGLGVSETAAETEATTAATAARLARARAVVSALLGAPPDAFPPPSDGAANDGAANDASEAPPVGARLVELLDRGADPSAARPLPAAVIRARSRRRVRRQLWGTFAMLVALTGACLLAAVPG